LEGDRITVNPKGLEEDGEGSPLRMPQSMITSKMPGPSSRMSNTPLYVAHLATLNMKPGNDLFFTHPPINNDARGSMPPPVNEWYRQQGMGLLHPTMNLPGQLSQQGQDPAWYGQQGAGNYPSVTPPGPHGQQGQALSPGPLGGGQMPRTTPLGQQGHPPAPGPPGMVQNARNATAAPQAPAAQQGGAQSAVQPPGGTTVGGMPQNMMGRVAQGTNSQDYSGISRALERLAPIMTDADTSRNLRWQQAVQGDNAKIATWKIEATSFPGLQFYACMQPGEAFMVLGHSMSTIYSTTTDISTLHGKIVLFTGDRKGTRECIPIILPP